MRIKIVKRVKNFLDVNQLNHLRLGRVSLPVDKNQSVIVIHITFVEQCFMR